MPELDIDEEYLLKENLSDDFKRMLENLEEKSKHLCTELEERLVIVTVTLKTLKENIKTEKELWKTEVKKTIEQEKKISEHNWQHYSSCTQFQMLTDAFIKSQTHIQKEISNSIYKQQLMEAENMCNMEMLKIKNSLECLVPLQAIVNEWNSDTDELKTHCND